MGSTGHSPASHCWIPALHWPRIKAEHFHHVTPYPATHTSSGFQVWERKINFLNLGTKMILNFSFFHTLKGSSGVVKPMGSPTWE